MKTFKVKGEQAKALINYLFERSQEFSFMPLPFDMYEIKVKDASVEETVRCFLRGCQPPARCDNCEQTSSYYTPLQEVEALAERLDPGAIVPAGECPECETFCYLVDK